MREVPIVRRAVDRRILRHRRHDYAVGDPELAQSDGREHRRSAQIGGRPRLQARGLTTIPLLGCFRHQRGIAQPQVFVRDLLAARQKADVELPRLELPEPSHVLEPRQRDIRRMLNAADFIAPLRFVGCHCAAEIIGLRDQRLVQRDRVFQCQFGTRANCVVRGVRSVTQQNNRRAVRARLPRRERDRRKLPPQRAISQHAAAFQFFAEKALDISSGACLVISNQAGTPPSIVGGFDNDRAFAGRIHVRVHVPQPVLVLTKAVEKPRQRQIGTEPDESIAAQIDRWRKRFLEPIPQRGVGAVRGDDQLRAAMGVDARIFDAVSNPHAEHARSPLQYLQQGDAFDPGEPVPR